MLLAQLCARHKILLEVGIKPAVKLVVVHITVVICGDRIHAVDVLGLLFCNPKILEDSGRYTRQDGVSHGCADAALNEYRWDVEDVGNHSAPQPVFRTALVQNYGEIDVRAVVADDAKGVIHRKSNAFHHGSDQMGLGVF